MVRSGPATTRQHALASRPAFPVGNLQKAGDAPHEAGFQIVQFIVGVNDLPKHLQQLDPLLVGEGPLDHPGEAVQLGRVGT